MQSKGSGAVFFGKVMLSVLMIALTAGVFLPAGARTGIRLAGLLAAYPPGSETETGAFSEPLTTQPSDLSSSETVEPAETEDGFADIRKMQADFAAAYADKTPSGTVSEEFFVTNGATDILGNVAIKNATATKKPDFAALLAAGPTLEVDDPSLPTVLIFHTHTTESYLQLDNGVFYKDYETRSASPERNMIRVGDELCRVLEENGIGVIHDTNVYDENYNGAYARSRVTVLDILAKNPTIRVVLDVHRDAIYYSDTKRSKPTAVINGEKAAQIMIITGAEEGQITDFPDWEENLKFALALQKTAQDKYEGLMRPIYFCQRKYNMDTALCSLLLEIGTDANTLEEACRSARMIGQALAENIR